MSRLVHLFRSSAGATGGVIVGVCLVLSILLNNLRTGIVTGLVVCGFAALAFALIDIGRPHNHDHHTG